jgi:casein kinase I family protein HRR25
MAQVREKKRAWTGATLGDGFPDVFGQLLDHSRALGFDENPDYARFQTLFDEFSNGMSISHETFVEPNMVTSTCEHFTSTFSR